MIHPVDRGIARSGYLVAVGLVERKATTLAVREAAAEALRTPTPDAIRPLLMHGRNQPWFPSVIDALAGVGIAAAELVLGDDPPQLPDGPRRWELQHAIDDLVDGMDVNRLERVLVAVQEIAR